RHPLPRRRAPDAGGGRARRARGRGLDGRARSGSRPPGAAWVSVKVKICGVTSPEDARDAVLAGADFLGVNFCQTSPRLVAVEQARAIAAAVPSVPLVGVFVDRPRDEIEAIVTAVGLQLVQLHGDEMPAQASDFTVPVIKALRPPPGSHLSALAARFATEYI